MIKLGDKVKDVLTGFEGIAWARTEYLTSPAQIGIMGRSIDNKPPDIMYVDEDRCIACSIVELQMVKYADTKLEAE